MRRSRALLAVAVSAATLTTGVGTAYAMQDKTVTITVDGTTHTLHTNARTVGGALADAHVGYAARDSVSPAASSDLDRDAHVTVRHARPLTLVVDGQRRPVWVVADTVGQALDSLDLGQLGAVVSAPRAARLPLPGPLVLRLPHDVTVVVDRTSRAVRSTDPTVAALLARLHVRLARTDRVSAPLGSVPAEGATIRVTRIRTKTLTTTSPIGYATLRKADGSMFKGDTRHGAAGHAGAVRRTYLATYVDGKLTTKKLVSSTTTPAHDAVVYYGTKSRPAPHRAPTASSSHRSSSSSHSSSSRHSSSGSSSHSGSGYGGLNWGALAQCESGGNPRAVNPSGTYRGLYQFSISTWHSVGGSGDPINASSGEQTYRAWLLYQSAGRGSWPVCGKYL